MKITEGVGDRVKILFINNIKTNGIVSDIVMNNGKRKVWFKKNQTCQSKQAYLSMAQRELYSLINMIVLKGVMQLLNIKIKK